VIRKKKQDGRLFLFWLPHLFQQNEGSISIWQSGHECENSTTELCELLCRAETFRGNIGSHWHRNDPINNVRIPLKDIFTLHDERFSRRYFVCPSRHNGRVRLGRPNTILAKFDCDFRTDKCSEPRFRDDGALWPWHDCLNVPRAQLDRLFMSRTK